MDILLPSNRNKRIDFDLLLIQQKRKLNKQFKEIEEDTNNIKLYFDQLSNKQKSFVKKACHKQKQHYKRKISWLFKKQNEERRLCKPNQTFYPKKKSFKNKKDRQRYLIRKKNKINKSNNEIVLNKSDVNLSNYDLQLLSFGPQFIPTPKWENKVIHQEKENLLKHIRAIEWKDVFMNKDESLVETNHFKCNLSHKLKVPNFSRPDKSQLTNNTESYIQVVRNKFRNLKIQVMRMHKFKNNLNKNLQKSL